jgi:hypothetical protein
MIINDKNDDAARTILEEEEMHFYSCVSDVIVAFLDHGVKNILKEIEKNPKLRNQLVEYFQKTNTVI